MYKKLDWILNLKKRTIWLNGCFHNNKIKKNIKNNNRSKKQQQKYKKQQDYFKSSKFSFNQKSIQYISYNKKITIAKFFLFTTHYFNCKWTYYIINNGNIKHFKVTDINHRYWFKKSFIPKSIFWILVKIVKKVISWITLIFTRWLNFICNFISLTWI